MVYTIDITIYLYYTIYHISLYYIIFYHDIYGIDHSISWYII